MCVCIIIPARPTFSLHCYVLQFTKSQIDNNNNMVYNCLKIALTFNSTKILWISHMGLCSFQNFSKGCKLCSTFVWDPWLTTYNTIKYNAGIYYLVKLKGKDGCMQFVNFTLPLPEITYHMGSHTSGRGDFPAFTPAEAGTQFSDPEEMQGWVDLGGGYIPKIVNKIPQENNRQCRDRDSNPRPRVTSPTT